MSNSYFQFKEFTVHQDRCAMKVTTDACLFGAWVAREDAGISALPRWKGKTRNILDIGAGTGLLSLMYAQQNTSAIVDAIEVDSDAFEQAQENISASPFADRILPIHADARTFGFAREYDTLLVNPPFYSGEIASPDEKRNLAHHHTGLLFEDLITIVRTNLAPGGRFYLLLPFKRNDEIKRLVLKQDLSISKIVLLRQSLEHGYFRLILAGSSENRGQAETQIEEISIWNHEQQFTREFMELLKDYYLRL